MEPDDEKNDSKQDEKDRGYVDKVLQEGRKKAKSTFSMIFRKILAIIIPILIKFAPLLVALGVLILAITKYNEDNGQEYTSEEAISGVLSNEEQFKIDKKVSGDEDDYYFKLDHDILSKYIEELNIAFTKGSYNEDIIGKDEDELSEDDINEKFTIEDITDWFGTEDEEVYKAYFAKMLRTHIASLYPKLGKYGTDENPTSKKDKKDNPIDEEGNYIVQGIVELQRVSMNSDGTMGETVQLSYVPYDEFQNMINNNPGEDILKKFSFDENTCEVFFATYTTEITEEVDSDGNVINRNEVGHYEKADPIHLSEVTSSCSMPYDFLYSLLKASKNPEWVMAVCDLLLEESEVVVTIQDQLKTVTDADIKDKAVRYETKYYEYTETVVESDSGTEIQGEWEEDEDRAETEYYFPAGQEVRNVTTNEKRTSVCSVTKAHTWFIDFETEFTTQNTEGEPQRLEPEYTEEDLERFNYYIDTPFPEEFPDPEIQKDCEKNQISYSDLITKATESSWKNVGVSSNFTQAPEINYEKFLGTFKNDTGRFYVGSIYDPEGIDIKYPRASDGELVLDAADSISDGRRQDIEWLVHLLSLHKDTEIHQKLMKYFWNIYTGEDIYDVSIEDITDLFGSSTLTQTSGGSYSSLIEFIQKQVRYWEGTGTIKTNAEGKECYEAYWDPYGEKVTIGPGVTTDCLPYFEEYGITSISEGDLIEVEIVDAVEEQVIKDKLDHVKGLISGLKDYQYAALTIASYNCYSLVQAFPGNYSTYWKETDDKYGEPLPYKLGTVSDGQAAEAMTTELKEKVNCDLYSNGWADYCHARKSFRRACKEKIL